MDGRPVKVTWTREDDLHHDFLHTVSVEYMKAGVGADGKVSAWLHRSVAPSLATIFAPNVNHEIGGELGMGFINMPYDIPNLRLENPEASAHCRIGWFRSVSNIPHAFAVQSFVSELAVKRQQGSPRLLAGTHRAGAQDRSATACKTIGITASRRSAIRWTPAACAAWSKPSRRKPAGARNSLRGRGLGTGRALQFFELRRGRGGSGHR